MKNKITIALALVIIMGAFLLPVTALATEYDGYDYGDDYAETIIEPEPETPLPVQSPWADSPFTANPFTPDGVATVVDNATDGDGKEFFTFQTPAGNVFFLVIDRSRGTDNVYFLNAVTEQDLVALAERPITTQPPNMGLVPPPLSPDMPNNPNGDVDETPIAPPTDNAENGNGTMIFIVLAVAAFGGAAYYIKIVRPKKQGANDDDDEYDESEENGEYDDEEDE